MNYAIAETVTGNKVQAARRSMQKRSVPYRQMNICEILEKGACTELLEKEIECCNMATD